MFNAWLGPLALACEVVSIETAVDHSVMYALRFPGFGPTVSSRYMGSTGLTLLM